MTAGNFTSALIVFERTGTHFLSPLLGEFKHVYPIVQCYGSGAMMAYNWLSGRVEMDYVGDRIADVAAFYQDQGHHVELTWVDRRPVERFAWPMIINNCVGHTKQVINFPSIAITPCGLLKAIQHRKGADMMRSLAISMTLPGKQLISPTKPKAPAPPPPPPTMLDAQVSSQRKRQRAAAAAATGAGGSVKNTGGQLGVSTAAAPTTKVMLGG